MASFFVWLSLCTYNTGRDKGLSRGFAFVAMSNADEHAAAIAALDQTEVGGRTIYVNESLPKNQVKKIRRNSNTPKRKIGDFH